MRKMRVASKQGKKHQFQKWLDCLLFFRNDARNRELISNCFFERFAQDPEQFYEFIRFFKNNLKINKNKKEQKEKAERYLQILSPLCERFSFFEEKNLLDDLCFEVVYPKKYKSIDGFFGSYKKKESRVIDEILRALSKILRDEKYDGKVKGRYKNLYSIYRKIEKKQKKNLLNINDIFAFRIILNDESEDSCFEVANLLHDRFYPRADLFKDYITIPKINGYQSLHTGLTEVTQELNIPIEVQIRTKAMDDFAEHGFASHWIYSQNKKAKIVTKKERQLMSYMTHFSEGVEEEVVYFFSHKGDIFKLQKGATIIDFGYHLHTELGNKMKGTLVNGQKESIYHPIQEGDKIQILLSEKNEVKKTWLQHSHTKHARKKIQEHTK